MRSMAEPADSPEPSRWPWILWTLTTVALLSLATVLDRVAKIAHVTYNQMEMKELPFFAELLFKVIDAVSPWFFAGIAASTGIPFAVRRNSEGMQRWTLVMVLLMIVVGAFL